MRFGIWSPQHAVSNNQCARARAHTTSTISLRRDVVVATSRYEQLIA